MSIGEVFLESLSTGVITSEEIAWVTRKQAQFSREEEAVPSNWGACSITARSRSAAAFCRPEHSGGVRSAPDGRDPP